MTRPSFDTRITPWREDLAAEYLKGQVESRRFVGGTAYQVCVDHAALRGTADPAAHLLTELLYGETFTVYENQAGWAWGQASLDDYVGYVDPKALTDTLSTPTHRVRVLRTFVFPEADLKSPPVISLSLNSKLSISHQVDKYSVLTNGGFVFTGHLSPVDEYADDFVAIAEMFLTTPYLWGGKTSDGADCSGLVQAALEAAGVPAPRDADMQEAVLGVALPDPTDLSALQRGDLVFWKGHMGVMVDAENFLHVNATYMAGTIEPLAPAAERIARTDGPITSIKRLS